MRIQLICLSAFLSLTLAGCTTVMSTQPVGEVPVALTAEDWEGTWTDSEDFLEIRVIDGEAGQLEAAWIETGEDGFELESVEIFMRRSGDALFGSVLDEPDDEAGVGDEEAEPEALYAFFRLARDGKKLVVWWPDVEAFQALVEEGRLPGEVTEGDDVVLEALSEAQLELLSSDQNAGLWEWKSPAILMRAERD